MAKHTEVGEIGEHIAAKYLQQQDHAILDCNFRRTWGELDIVSERGGVVHFVEVKTVSYETKSELQIATRSGTYRPEEQIDDKKLQKLKRTISSWVTANQYTGDVQLDVVSVRVVIANKYATVEYFSNVSL